MSNGRHYIGGDFVVSACGDTAAVLEKATGTEIGTCALGTDADVRLAVASAMTAQRAWAARLPAERAAALRRMAGILESRADEFTDVLVRETGGVVAKARGEVAAAISRLHVCASLGALSRGDVQPSPKPGKLTLLERVPLGVIGVITPWNFPLVLAMRAIAPALAVGNAVVLKPAELTPIAGGQLLAEVAAEAGLPPGVLNVVTGLGPAAGQPLAEHPDVALIHFTGSNEVGRLVASIAGLRRTSLELGGDNAFVVLDDLDDAGVERAATCGAWSSFDFQGQTCITSSRHLVDQRLHDAYVAALVRRAGRIVVGDPALPGTDLGPLISAAQRDRVHSLVTRSVAMGAEIVIGGKHHELFYEPTVVTGVTPEMPLFTEEVFGPVAPVTAVDSEEEALRLVNSCQSLVNAVWTANPLRGLAFAQRVDSRNVHVNDAGPRPTDADDVDLDEFTRRRWIGVQTSELTYPEWAR